MVAKSGSRFIGGLYLSLSIGFQDVSTIQAAGFRIHSMKSIEKYDPIPARGGMLYVPLLIVTHVADPRLAAVLAQPIIVGAAMAGAFFEP